MKTKLIRCDGIVLNTQVDCFNALIAGFVLKRKNSDDLTCKIVDGFIKSSNDLSFVFNDPVNWEAFEEKQVEWFEDIPEQGVLCWVDDYYRDRKDYIHLIKDFLISPNPRECKFRYNSIKGWVYATPLTKEEVEKYIYAQS
jgi:hypothetical protein